MPIAEPFTADYAHDQTLLAWQTPEFIPHPKGTVWFLVFGVIILSLTVYAILSGSATMAIVFILLAGMVTLTHNQEPKMIDIKIMPLGMKIADQFYAWSQIKAFWIVFNPPFVQRLYLRLAEKSGRRIKVELNQQNPVEIRQMLARELPEVEGGEESMTDLFIRLLRLQ